MLDLRRIRIGIEVSGAVNWYEGLRVRVSGTKHADPTKNDCTVIVSGLNRQTRDYLLTETSPFNDNPTPKRLIVEVGRERTGMFRLFMGDIVSAEPSQPPDLDVTIKAATMVAQAGNVISTSAPPTCPLSVIAKQVASDLGVTLDFQAQDKNIGNYQHTGACLDQVRKLQESGGVSAYIDDNILVVKDIDRPLNGRMRILNKDSGMVGIPRANETGVSVTYLIDPDTAIGGGLRIQSKINRAISGDYVINQLKFEATTHDTPFFYTAETTRL